MNKRLGPLELFLVEDPKHLDPNVRREHDLCDAFFRHVNNCFRLLPSLYQVGYFFKLRKIHVSVPPDMDYELDNEGREILERAQRFLSAPALPTICDGILRMDQAMLEEPFPTDFADEVILDLQAILCKIPVPSFVASDMFHGRLRELFPRPRRTDLERHLLLPGSFPEDEAVEEEAKDVPPSPPPAPRAPIMTPPRTPSPPPVIAKTRLGKLERFYTEHLQIVISGQTPQEFHKRFYQESKAHRDIQSSYVTEFLPKDPRDPAETKRPRSILRRHRPLPKRLAETRRLPPRVVRFTENTLSPRPRSLTGLDVPRLIDGDEERKNEDAPAAWTPVGLRPMTPLEDSIFLRTGSLGAEDDFWLREDGDRAPGLGQEAWKRMHAAASPSIEELMNEPTVPGLSSRPVEEILESLKQKNKIDLSHKRAVEAEEAKRRAAEEARRAEEEAKRRAEEQAQQKAEEDEQQRELERILAQTGGLRPINCPLIAPLSERWAHEVERALEPGTTRLLARTPEGIELRRHDFDTLIPPTNWLNDEIVNGSLGWLDRAINGAAGIKDTRRQTRKCLVMGSFFFKYLMERGVDRTERNLRRNGVTKDNLLDVETIVLPICMNSHWTVLVIRPTKRTVVHMDSLSPNGSQSFRSLGLQWIKYILQEKFVESEWHELVTEAPTQSNSYDCGVFTITNAMCLALGLSPIHSYEARDMPLQRRRIAAALMNGGFRDEFDLSAY